MANITAIAVAVTLFVGCLGEISFSVPQQIFGPNLDLAEPIITTDGTHLWVMASGEGVIRACVTCPNWPQVFTRTDDQGGTWTAYKYVCPCDGVVLQADPWMAASRSGTLYASWMNGFSIAFARSHDLGATWSSPHNISASLGDLPCDKDAVTTSTNGSVVFVAFTCGGYPYASVSTDSGITWTEPQAMLLDPQSYPHYEFFGNGGVILSDGTMISSQGGFYNPDNSSDQSLPAAVHIYRSTDGLHWTRALNLVFYAAQYCPPWAQCLDPGQFFGPTVVVAADQRDVLYAVASAASNQTSQPDQTLRILFAASTDYGQSWSAFVDLSLAPLNQSVFHGFPLVAATGYGNVHVAWMDNRTGWWNVWCRQSIDGGQTWSAEVKVSAGDGGRNAPFHTEQGFV